MDLAAFARPTLTIVDAYRVLMRGGPTGGSLADVELKKTLLAGTDPVALDAYAAKAWWDLDYQRLPFLRLAQARGLGQGELRRGLADRTVGRARAERHAAVHACSAVCAASRRSLFLAAFLFLLFRSEFTGFVPRRRRARSGCPGRSSIFLEADPLAAVPTALSTAHALSRPALEPGHPGSDLLPRPLLLRLDLPARHAATTSSAACKSEKKRGQGAHRVEPLQAVAGDQVLRPGRGARWRRCSGRCSRACSIPSRSPSGRWRCRSCPAINYASGALLDALLRQPWRPVRLAADALAVRPAGHAASASSSRTSARRFFLGADLRRPARAQPARHAVLVPRALPARRAARRRLALVARCTCEKDPAACDDCNRCLLHCQGGDDPIPGADVAQGRVPPLLQLRRRLPDARRGVPLRRPAVGGDDRRAARSCSGASCSPAWRPAPRSSRCCASTTGAGRRKPTRG